MPSLSIVIPAYNEAATLVDLVHHVVRVLHECVHDSEIIILDDCSRDTTVHINEHLRGTYPHLVRGMRHEVNMGIAQTFEDLYQAATKEFVFLIPGDAEYSPEIVRSLIPFLEHADIVICERASKRRDWKRDIISWFYAGFTRLLFGIDIRSPGAVKCLRTRLIWEIPVTSHGVFRDAERVIRAARRGYRVVTLPVDIQERQQGRGASGRLILQALRDMIALRIQLLGERR